MLMCGIIDELEHEMDYDAKVSFFFCQATDERINNATSVLRSLIYLITEKQPSLIHQHSRLGLSKFGAC